MASVWNRFDKDISISSAQMYTLRCKTEIIWGDGGLSPRIELLPLTEHAPPLPPHRHPLHPWQDTPSFPRFTLLWL